MDEYINKYAEILKLDKMLTARKIPHTLTRFMDGWQVIYPEDGERRVMDAVEFDGTYGSNEDLLEIMGLLTPEEQEVDTVCGRLTAEDVFKRIERHYLHANDLNQQK